jgi:hypothetical protein
LDLKEKNYDILSDIDIGIGIEIKFKSMDLDFNEFPNSEMFKPFLNRKFGIWSKGSKFKPTALNQGHFKIYVKDLNFKRKFSLMDLNSIYFIEFKGRFRMDIGSNFEWIGVNSTRNIFQIFLSFPLMFSR